jgi:membrane fusion protein, copper/silver efflux system
MLTSRTLLIVLCFFLLTPFSTLASEPEHDHTTETVWTCSMHPQIQLPESGQCPICFMDLIEVVKESDKNRQSLRQISFDRRARKLAEVEVHPVTRGHAATEVHMVGKIDYDETRVGTITSWVNGRIDKLFVDYTGSQVRRGQAMANIYSPELVTAQAELIQALAAFKRTKTSENAIIRNTASRTLNASREKLRLLGLSSKQLEGIEQLGKPTNHITLTAPLSGIVIKKDVNEGMYVKTGSPIYTLADLKRLWIILEAYESDLQSISLGQQVDFTVESYPGTAFQGQVAYIDPLVNEKSRTIRIRLNVENSDGKLKPGMFVRAISSSSAPTDSSAEEAPLLIPISAPLITGKRALVYVQVENQPGTYIGREIVLGARQGGFYQVKSGLMEGELLVTRGNFKIDSAIQLQARPSMMNPYFENASQTEKTYPTLFISKLNLLNSAFAELSKAIHDENKAAIQSQLNIFTSSLGNIDASPLDEEDKLSWQELSMLIGSDTILLAEADNRMETERIYVPFAEHFHAIRKHFNLNNVAAIRTGSPVLQNKISKLVAQYLALELLLAADDTEAAKINIKDLLPLSESVVENLLTSGDELATTIAVNLAESNKQLAITKDLTTIRAAFYPLSENMVQLVENIGSSSDTPLFVQFCPMAFENKGATWLASTEEINNPYFGAMMLRCGEVRKQLKQ